MVKSRVRPVAFAAKLFLAPFTRIGSPGAVELMAREPADSHVTLKIPRPLYEQLKQVIQGSGFHSVTEFAVYVLRDLVSHHGEQIVSALRPDDIRQAGEKLAGEKHASVEPLSPEEIEAIRRRLESLGYL
jgi:hypothetical protein